jgi:hypothetical protein
MSDDLRDRIATAVARELVLQARASGEYQTRNSYNVADAVIAELGLHECDDQDCRCRHTAVTDWTAND